MNIFDELTKGVIKHPEQGYAMFFYNNGEVLTKVHGKVADNNSDDISFDTNFRLASVSKQFIAFAIVNLIKNNLLSYDTIVKDIFCELPNYFNDITIKHLLNHTSGIYNYEDMPHKDDDPQLLDKDIIKFLISTDRTYFTPGSCYKYSNTGYILLGLIVEKVSNISIVEYVEKEIFEKAGMKESKVNIQGVTKIKNRAYGHLIDNNELYVKDQYWCSATIGDGGLYSSINDLKKWCNYLIKTDHFNDMKIPNFISEDEYNEYGLGIRIIKVGNSEIYYHCGDTIGTNTLLLFSKDLKLCLIFLTNLGGINTSIMKDNLLKILD